MHGFDELCVSLFYEVYTDEHLALDAKDLTCDLVSPLFVSGLTACVSYVFAASFLGGMSTMALIAEASSYSC